MRRFIILTAALATFLHCPLLSQEAQMKITALPGLPGQKITAMIKGLLFFALFFAQVLNAQQLTWPEVTRDCRPWTRWWWPGNIVNPSDITHNLEIYKKAGLGGVEITPIYGVKGQEEKFIDFLSPEWMKMFTHTLAESERLDMGVDLANASGWPFGGPWVSPEDACRNINYKTYSVTGGNKLDDRIVFIQQPLVRPVGVRPDISKLVDPISRNKNLQLYALDQIRFEKPLPLQALIAYSDGGEFADLTGRVTTAGELDWTAPPGNWTLWALFQGWHGKMVERAGPGGEGDVIDHFSGQAIDNYLNHFDKPLMGYDISTLRSWFNDSYEVDDASGQADWTNDLFYEFYIRRSYDLGEHLPALFQKDSPEKNERVLSDYRQTVSDLLLEKFTSHWTRWANRQGKLTRNQAHGSPGNILDLYAASDIPEAEGNEITRFKFASSASNVVGKQYTSCEAATWLNEHFISTLSDVRKSADLFFLGGINHLFYHGTCFSPPDEPWPGFLFYAAVEFTPANPFWNDFHALNEYITRVQSFLQRGRPDNEILLYFPIFDKYADYGRGMLEHFDGISPFFDGTSFKTAAESMLERGYAYDFISDLQITNTESENGLLYTEGNVYKTLVVPACKYIPVETFAHILKLASDGATIIFYGDLPANVAGFGLLDEKNKAFERMKASINFQGTNYANTSGTTFGKGRLLTGDNLEGVLSLAGISRESMADYDLGFVRREYSTGFTWFIVNKGEKQFEGWLPFNRKFQSAGIFNPMTGNFGTADIRDAGKENIEIFMRLAPGESVIIESYHDPVKGNRYPFFSALSPPLEIKGNWKVDFIAGGPVLPPSVEIAELKSWTEFGEDAYRDFSGSGRYLISFTRPKTRADAWMLDMGDVKESATVILNGSKIASLIGPDFRLIINRKQLKKNNTLEIVVSNLMANRIAFMDRNEIEWKRFYNINMAARLKQNNKNGLFDASAWEPMESGLTGPVTLTPVMVRGE